MNTNKLILIFLISTLIISCNKKSYNDDRIVNFEFSECQENCIAPDGMISDYYNNGNLKIKFGALLNCGTDSVHLESIKIKGDTLFLKLNESFQIIDRDTVYTSTDCDCYFNAELELTKLNKKPKYLKFERIFEDTTFIISKNRRIMNSLNTDSIFPTEKLFISIIPSNNYLDSMRNSMKGKDWNDIYNDYEYERNNIERGLIKLGYKLYKKPNNEYLYFKLPNGRIQKIDSKNLNNRWGNLIFNGKDSAFIYDLNSNFDELKKL